MLKRSCTRLACFLSAARGFCTSSADRMAVSVLFQRLPIVVPKIDPEVYAFKEFSFRWKQQYRRLCPEKMLEKSDAKSKGEFVVEDFVPAPRITEADKTNDRRSLNRALDRKLFLLVYGTTFEAPDKPMWHFPEKLYEGEKTIRKCAESALEGVLEDLACAYFVGNTPIGHMVVRREENNAEAPLFTRFFMESEVVGEGKVEMKQCEDHAWVTKEEAMEFFPLNAEFLRRMMLCHPF